MENTATIPAKRSRNSSVELLRILAACMIVVLHYNGRAMNATSGISTDILALLESLCVCGVNLFIMISGYFLCKTQKRTWGKPAYLLLILSVIFITAYISKSYVTGRGISWFTVIHSVLPPKNYFVLLYITLYIISPYINIVLNRLTDKSRTVFIVVLLLLFSIYPTLMDIYQSLLHGEVMGVSTIGAWGNQHGYTIVNFVLCYCLGAYIKMNNLTGRFKNWKILLGCVVLILFIFAWFDFWLHRNQSPFRLLDCNALNYSNPLVIALSAMLLLLFTGMHFESHFINTLAKAAFVCYLFHLEILEYLKINEYAQQGGLSLYIHLFVCVITIYLVSWVIWRLLEFALSPIVKLLDRYEIIPSDEMA